jgi:hypothetical protein
MTKKYIDTGYNKSDGDGPGEKELQEIKETYLNDLTRHKP